MDLPYSEIEKYLVNYEISGGKIFCEFQSPSGEIFESSAPIKASKTVVSEVQKQVARVAKQQARRQAGRLIRGVLGGGMMGRIGSKVARGSISDIGENSEETYSAADQEEAISKAFSRVARNFGVSRRGEPMPKRESPERDRRERPDRDERRAQRDERRGGRDRRTSNSSDSEYQSQLHEYPVSNVFEQEILARFLVEIAGADGRITKDEKDFLADLIPRRFGSIEDLQAKGAISRIEAEELEQGVKETIYLLGWSLAIADFEVDHGEIRKLLTYGELFGIPDHRKEALAKMAKTESLEQAITESTTREDLFQLSDGLDMSREEAERCLINYKKKMY